MTMSHFHGINLFRIRTLDDDNIIWRSRRYRDCGFETRNKNRLNTTRTEWGEPIVNSRRFLFTPNVMRYYTRSRIPVTYYSWAFHEYSDTHTHGSQNACIIYYPRKVRYVEYTYVRRTIDFTVTAFWIRIILYANVIIIIISRPSSSVSGNRYRI